MALNALAMVTDAISRLVTTRSQIARLLIRAGIADHQDEKQPDPYDRVDPHLPDCADLAGQRDVEQFRGQHGHGHRPSWLAFVAGHWPGNRPFGRVALLVIHGEYLVASVAQIGVWEAVPDHGRAGRGPSACPWQSAVTKTADRPWSTTLTPSGRRTCARTSAPP